MSETNSVDYLKNNRFHIFKYQGILIFIKQNNEDGHGKLLLLKRNILKEFCILRSYQRLYCFETYISIINNFRIEYQNNFDVKKLFIREKKNDKTIDHRVKHVSDKNILNNLLNNIKQIDLIEDVYIISSIFRYNDIFVLIYYDEHASNTNKQYYYINTKCFDSIKIKIFENDVKIFDDIFLLVFDKFGYDTIDINFNEHNLIFKKRVATYEIFIDDNLMKEITLNEYLPKNISDDIEFHKENYIKESEKLSDWINYFNITNFLSFDRYNFNIFYNK